MLLIGTGNDVSLSRAAAEMLATAAWVAAYGSLGCNEQLQPIYTCPDTKRVLPSLLWVVPVQCCPTFSCTIA